MHNNTKILQICTSSYIILFASNFNFSDVWIHIFQCNPKRLQHKQGMCLGPGIPRMYHYTCVT